MTEEEFLQEELDCAGMMGLTLGEYRKEVKNFKPYFLQEGYKEEEESDDRLSEILEYFGLTEEDLLK